MKDLEIKVIKIGQGKALGLRIKTAGTFLLLIKAPKGFLACRYVNVKIANLVDDSAVIVKGVKTFRDMLKAPVFQVSRQARTLGIKKGISGRAALARMF